MSDAAEALRSQAFDAFFFGYSKPWHFIVSYRQDEEKKRWQRRIDAALAPALSRIATLEAERDTAREEAARWKASYTRAAEHCTQACKRREAVEAENERLRKALGRVADQSERGFACKYKSSLKAWLQDINTTARAALEPQEPDNG